MSKIDDYWKTREELVRARALLSDDRFDLCVRGPRAYGGEMNSILCKLLQSDEFYKMVEAEIEKREADALQSAKIEAQRFLDPESK